MADKQPTPIELAQQAIADDAEHRTSRGGVIITDELSRRQRTREPELARLVLQLLDEKRDHVAWHEVEIERQRKRLRAAAIAYAAAPDSEQAQDELEMAGSVLASVEQGLADALEAAGFGRCDACGTVTPLDQLHLYYEDLDGICPGCIEEAQQEQQERAARREAKRRRRLL